jgi:hypothetical protein
MSAQTKEKVVTERAEIYCERWDNGHLLLLITGAESDAGFYSSAADILADEFTVVSYDIIIIPTISMALSLCRKLRNPRATPALIFLFMKMIIKQNS